MQNVDTTDICKNMSKGVLCMILYVYVISNTIVDNKNVANDRFEKMNAIFEIRLK